MISFKGGKKLQRSEGGADVKIFKRFILLGLIKLVFGKMHYYVDFQSNALLS